MSENELQTRQADFTSHEQRQQPAEAAKSTQASEAMKEIEDKVADYGDQALDKLDQGKAKAADVMSQTASTIREKTSSSGGMAADAGAKLATGMESVASYTKEHNTSEMMDDLEAYIKKHPGQAVAGAVVAGFLLGKIIVLGGQCKTKGATATREPRRRVSSATR